MGVPLYVICHFSLVVFNILPVFNFCQFDNCESWCVPPWDYPAWDPLCFLELVDCFLYYVWEVFSYYLLKYFLRYFLSLSPPSGTPIMWMLVHLMLSQRSHAIAFHSFLYWYFSVFGPAAVISIILSSRSFIHSSASVILCYFLLVYYSSLFVL